MRSVALFALTLGAAAILGSRLNLTYPIGDWLLLDLAKIWLYEIVLSAACVGAGYAVIERCLPMRARDELQSLALAFPLGLLVFVMGMYAGGVLALYGPAFALALPFVMLVVGVAPAARAVRRVRAAAAMAPPRARAGVLSPAMSAAIVAAGILGLGVLYLGVMSPAAINYDASWMHLVIAQDYAREGRIVRFPGNWVKNVPHLGSIVNTWAFLVPGLREPALRWTMALHTEFTVFLWTLVTIAAMTRWLLRRHVRNAWASFLLFPGIFVYDSNLGGAADHFLALFAAPLFLVTARALPRFAFGPCVLWGAMAGAALLTKLQAFYLLAPLLGVVVVRVAVLAVRRVRDRGPTISVRVLIGGPFIMALTALLVFAPHLAINYAHFRNPIYPLGQGLFAASSPTVKDAPLYINTLFAHWGIHPPADWGERLRQAAKMSVTFSFVPHYSFENNRLMFGALFTLALPFLLFLRNARRLWLASLVGLGAVFCWALTYWVDRNLQTFAPVLIAATAALIARAWTLGRWARAGLGMLIAVQVAGSGDLYFSGSGRMFDSVALIRSGAAGQAKQRFSHYRREYVELGAALPRDATVLLHNAHSTLGIDRRVLLDWVGYQGVIDYRQLNTSRELYDHLKRLGVTHVVFLPSSHAGPSKKEDVIFHSFVALHGQSQQAFGGLRMFALPDTPPAVREPYRVLTAGLGPYGDGLYRVDVMDTCEELPPSMQTFAKPSVIAPQPFEVLDQADVVLLGTGVKVDEPTRKRLARDFVLVTDAGSFKMWLRPESAGPYSPS